MAGNFDVFNLKKEKATGSFCLDKHNRKQPETKQTVTKS